MREDTKTYRAELDEFLMLVGGDGDRVATETRVHDWNVAMRMLQAARDAGATREAAMDILRDIDARYHGLEFDDDDYTFLELFANNLFRSRPPLRPSP